MKNVCLVKLLLKSNISLNTGKTWLNQAFNRIISVIRSVINEKKEFSYVGYSITKQSLSSWIDTALFN